ncbi:flocculation protein FLO11-like isoform X2 [Chrysoperla carnea]|uniref:flocculation protein FLO11-like isoform X2 n=1 Tax=Chrysoperla carnea TaxID=189513 RepID=UPI001D05D54C|nr:flocculation protein FLO11-like isoform X2 [Chrysoperla carnea]
MDNSSSDSHSYSNLSSMSTPMHPHKAHRRRFFTSIAKWFYTDATYENGTNLDVVDLVIVLQSLGFKLQHFEKIENIKNGELKVQISCGVSEFEAMLTLPNVSCKCPVVNNDGGEFWEVTGSGPASIKGGSSTNVVNEAGSSLLPSISKATCGVVRDVMACLLSLVHSPPDVNQNTVDDQSNNMGTATMSNCLTASGYRFESLSTAVSLSSELKGLGAGDPDHTTTNHIVPPIMVRSCILDNKMQATPPQPKPSVEITRSSTPSKLLREKTWDLDSPKSKSPNINRTTKIPSPRPASASSTKSTSPIPQICNGMNTLTIQQPRNYKDADIAVPLRDARRNIDKVLRILTNSKTPPSSGKKIPVLKNSPKRPSSYNPRSITPTLQKLPNNNSLSKTTDLSLLRKRSVTKPNEIVSRYSKPSRLSLDSNAPRPNTAPKTLQRAAIIAKRRVSPETRGTSSSTCSSTHSGSVGNLVNIETSSNKSNLRNPFGFMPRSRTNSSASSTASPNLPRKYKI